MPLSVIETNRELKNKITGIDLYVSDYQEIPHKLRKSTYMYHVIVITNLFYYKTRKHKEADVVQFMVSKSFDEFRELYNQLYDRFPSVNFPSLPAQSLVSTDYKAQLQCMDDVFKIVAETQKLSSSPMVIKFLKGEPFVKKPSFFEEDDFEEEKENRPEEKKEEETIVADTEEDLFTSPTQTERTINEDEINAITEDTVEQSSYENSIFAEDNTGVNGHSNEEFVVKQPERKVEYDSEDDFDDLLSVRKDVDDIFSLIKTSNKQSLTKTSQQTAIQRRTSKSKTDTNESGEDIFQKAKKDSIKRKNKDTKNLDDIFSSKSSSLFEPDVDDDLFTSKVSTHIKQQQENQITDITNVRDIDKSFTECVKQEQETNVSNVTSDVTIVADNITNVDTCVNEGHENVVADDNVTDVTDDNVTDITDTINITAYVKQEQEENVTNFIDDSVLDVTNNVTNVTACIEQENNTDVLDDSLTGATDDNAADITDNLRDDADNVTTATANIEQENNNTVVIDDSLTNVTDDNVTNAIEDSIAGAMNDNVTDVKDNLANAATYTDQEQENDVPNVMDIVDDNVKDSSTENVIFLKQEQENKDMNITEVTGDNVTDVADVMAYIKQEQENINKFAELDLS